MINESFVMGFAAGLAAAVVLCSALGTSFMIIRPWIRMKMMSGRGTLFHVIGMRLRGTPPMLIIEAYTSLLHAGEEVRLTEVESQYVAHRADIRDVSDLMDHVREHLRRGKATRKGSK